MTFFWILVISLLATTALILALWSMREYSDRQTKPGKETRPDEKGAGEKIGKDGEKGLLRGTIIIPKNQKVIK